MSTITDQTACPKRRLPRLLRSRKADFGILILVLFATFALLAPVIAPGDPMDLVARPHRPPSAEYLLGTSGQGANVFAQLVWGTRTTLSVSLAVGVLATLIGVVVGMSAGYFGGVVDDALSLLINLFLIIPGLPLMVVLAAFMRPGPIAMIFVLTFTGWAWPARVLRSQTLSMREKDFVSAALVSGESSARIIFAEILPGIISLAVSGMIGSTVYAIGASVALEFLGLGNVSRPSWGVILFWAQNNQALLRSAWWTFVPVGICMASVAFGLTMINYAIDEISNPRLRAASEVASGFKKYFASSRLITPVVRRAS